MEAIVLAADDLCQSNSARYINLLVTDNQTQILQQIALVLITDNGNQIWQQTSGHRQGETSRTHFWNVDTWPEQLEMFTHLVWFVLGIEDRQLREHAHVRTLEAYTATQAALHPTARLRSRGTSDTYQEIHLAALLCESHQRLIVQSQQ